MALPSISPAAALLLRPEPLTPAAFAHFGTVVASPLCSGITAYPPDIPLPVYPDHQPRPVPANQSTALKSSPISPLTNNYPTSHGSPSQAEPSAGLMSIFSSFPRQNIYTSSDESASTRRQNLKLKLGILERHPYTTQTFCPFNYSAPHPGPSEFYYSIEDKTYMLILVAPTLPKPSSHPPNPPDLTHIRAFLAPLNDPNTPTMAVTYAPGTWHAPMIVLGSRRVDFLVTQFANGVADDDCQEVLIGSGPDESTLTDDVRERRTKEGFQCEEIEVDVSFLLEGYKAENEATTTGKSTSVVAEQRTFEEAWKAKL